MHACSARMCASKHVVTCHAAGCGPGELRWPLAAELACCRLMQVMANGCAVLIACLHAGMLEFLMASLHVLVYHVLVYHVVCQTVMGCSVIGAVGCSSMSWGYGRCAGIIHGTELMNPTWMALFDVADNHGHTSASHHPATLHAPSLTARMGRLAQ